MKLDKSYIKNVSSEYLDRGRSEEKWEILHVDVEGDRLVAEVRMQRYMDSGTDGGEFHLSFITALEIASQLQIIYFHTWAGLERKTMEGWMAECKMKSHAPVTNPKSIKVEMIATRARQLGERYYVAADHRVFDDQGGLSEITLKTFVS